jgi:hypothetical protein
MPRELSNKYGVFNRLKHADFKIKVIKFGRFKMSRFCSVALYLVMGRRCTQIGTQLQQTLLAAQLNKLMACRTEEKSQQLREKISGMTVIKINMR